MFLVVRFASFQFLHPYIQQPYQKILNSAKLIRNEKLYALNVPNKRYDAGDKFGFIKANIDLALEREDIGPQLKEYLKNL